MLRFATALFGITLALWLFGAQPVRADDSQQVGMTANAQPPNIDLTGANPVFDMAQVNSESVLGAVFMTAVLGFVVFGRNTRRTQTNESNGRYDRYDRYERFAPSPMLASSAGFVIPASATTPPLPAMPPIAAMPPRVPAPSLPPAEASSEAGDELVWVNTKTGVVHEKGSRWFGKTREGEFMPKHRARSATEPTLVAIAA